LHLALGSIQPPLQLAWGQEALEGQYAPRCDEDISLGLIYFASGLCVTLFSYFSFKLYVLTPLRRQQTMETAGQGRITAGYRQPGIEDDTLSIADLSAEEAKDELSVRGYNEMPPTRSTTSPRTQRRVKKRQSPFKYSSCLGRELSRDRSRDEGDSRSGIEISSDQEFALHVQRPISPGTWSIYDVDSDRDDLGARCTCQLLNGLGRGLPWKMARLQS